MSCIRLCGGGAAVRRLFVFCVSVFHASFCLWLTDNCLADHIWYAAKLFDRDPDTGEVLWFAAPPLNLPRARGPRHSLEYLQFLARKRKQGQTHGNIEDYDDAPTKRPRNAVIPTVTETTIQVLKELSVDGNFSMLSLTITPFDLLLLGTVISYPED